MDKKVFLLDKFYYSETMLLNLTEKDLEEWVAEAFIDGLDCINVLDLSNVLTED